jgi:Uncharacterized protein conserved in bacteria (DUF2125)
MRRRPLAFAALGLAALAILYTAYWFALARTVARDVAAWVAFYRSQGYAISYSQPPLAGFPFAVTARFVDPDVVAPSGLWRWRGAEMRLSVQPWAPYELQFAAPGNHRLTIAGTAPRELAIAAGRFNLDMHLRDGLQPDRFGLTLAEARIEDSRLGTTLVGQLAVDGRYPFPPPADPSGSSLDLIASLARLQLPAGVQAPLGRDIYSTRLVAQVMGPLPDGAPRQALQGWSAAGGDLELREIELMWGGLWLKGDATLAFDRALQPLFAGSFAVANPGQVLDKLVAAGLLAPGAGQAAKIMFAALAVAPPEGGQPQVRLPLTIQDGYLYMGPVKLAALRPLDWSWLP